MRIKDKQNHGCLNGLMRADTTSVGKKQVMPNQVVRATQDVDPKCKKPEIPWASQTMDALMA